MSMIEYIVLHSIKELKGYCFPNSYWRFSRNFKVTTNNFL